MAGNELGSLYYDINIKGNDLDKELDAADKKVQDFGANVSDTGDKLKSNLNKTAVALGAAGAGLTLISKNATDFTVQLVKDSKDLARVIGTSTEEASRLSAAMGRVGISAENSSQLFGIFAKKIQASSEATTDQQLATEKLRNDIEKTKMKITETSQEIQLHGDKTGTLNLKIKELNNTLSTQQNELSKSSDAFGKLGIKTTDANGNTKDFTTLLFEVADKFKTMPDGIDKTSTSMELFGRQGKEMIKVLNLGSEGIKDLEKKADEMGLTLDAKTIGKVNDLVQAQKDLKGATDGMKIAIGTATAPVLTEFNKTLANIVTNLVNNKGPLGDITVGILAFGGPAFTAAAAALAFGANIATIAPAVPGFIAGMRGVAAAIWSVNVAIWTSPITWLVLAIAAIGVAIYLAITHFNELGAVVVTVFDWLGMKIKGVWDWISQNWPTLLAILFGPFGIAVKLIVDHWQGIHDFFSELPGKIGNFISGVAETIKKPFKDAFDAVVRFWNNTVGKIHFTAPSWVPGFGGKGWSMPKFAKGGIATGPTVGMFGEAGPEAVLPLSYLDRYNNLFDRIENMATGKGDTNITSGGTTINIGNIEDKSDADYIIRRFDRNSKLEGMGLSPA